MLAQEGQPQPRQASEFQDWRRRSPAGINEGAAILLPGPAGLPNAAAMEARLRAAVTGAEAARRRTDAAQAEPLARALPLSRPAH